MHLHSFSENVVFIMATAASLARAMISLVDSICGGIYSSYSVIVMATGLLHQGVHKAASCINLRRNVYSLNRSNCEY